MRALSAGIVVLTASMAILDGARAQIEPQRPPGSGFMQAPIGPRQPTLDHLQAATMTSNRSTRTIMTSTCRPVMTTRLAPARSELWKTA